MFWSLFLVLLSLEFPNISIWVNKTMAERNNHFLRQHATFCLHDYSYLNFRVTNKYWPSLKP